MPTKPTSEAEAQIELSFGPPTITPRGDGTFIVAPGKPVAGVETVNVVEAAKILGYKARSSVHEEVLNHPLSHLIKWRYTPGGGKILIEKASLLVFKAATSRPAEK